MRKLQIVVTVAGCVALAACVSTYQARNVKPSGFLGESASLLEKGGKNDLLLVYRKKNTDWTSYDQIVLDPVTLWRVENSNLTSDQLADYQSLVDDFHRTLKDKLSRNFGMIDAPAPGAVRIQIAIIDGQQANAPLKVAKAVAPFAGYADTVWTFITGKPAFSGEVSIEFMARDSQSEELLVAGADRRVGGNQLGKSTLSSWGDVQNILVYWSGEVSYLMCVNRGIKDCPKPKAGLLKNPLM
jgi:Protein of unknown function (DUF3313)